jgi:hypothetical protein
MISMLKRTMFLGEDTHFKYCLACNDKGDKNGDVNFEGGLDNADDVKENMTM